jgi:hypothetical protein
VATLSALISFSLVAGAGGAYTVKPGHKPFGKSYGEWHAAGWKSYLEHPVSESPAAGNGTLCGTTRGAFHPHLHGPGRLECTIEAGTPILKPVAVNLCINAEPSIFPPVRLRRCATRILRQPLKPDRFSLRVDGQRIARIRSYRAVSAPFHLDLPKDDILTYWGDTANPRTAKAVAAGWLVMLRPLPVGEHRLRHCLHDPDRWSAEFSGCHTIVVTVTASA